MNTTAVQIKLTLPEQLNDFITSKAAKFGMPVATYIKHLVVKDVKDMEIPVFQASERVEKTYKQAMKERSKATIIDDLDKFMKQL